MHISASTPISASIALPPWLHEQAKYLCAQLDRLAHCQLLLDAQRENARLLGRVVMQAVLCLHKKDAPCGCCQSCHLFLHDQHPDAIQHTHALNIEDVRQLQQKISRTPTISARRVIFLPDIENYNDHAANALLKTLEEPQSCSYFILAATARRAVKRTIVSRARCMQVRQPTQIEALDYLQQQGKSPEIAARLLQHQHGNPYMALAQTVEDNPLDILQDMVNFLAHARSDVTLFERLETLSDTRWMDTFLINIEAIAKCAQLDSLPQTCHNPDALRTQISKLNIARIHSLYAAICRLRMPDRQQIGIASNIKALLVDFFDSRMTKL